jgi:hypothetical protein
MGFQAPAKIQELENILANPLGIIFIGGPHEGVYVAALGLIAARSINNSYSITQQILFDLDPGASAVKKSEKSI